jgi:hypothetical protein
VVLLSPGWRVADPGLPYAALSGQETQKAAHRASSQQTDDVLARLAGTRLPDELKSGPAGQIVIPEYYAAINQNEISCKRGAYE